MSSIDNHKILIQAKDYFSQNNYKKALEKFATVLRNNPDSKEAYNGVILSEMALSGEGGAEALFDYYEVLQTEDKEGADEIMGEILENMDGTLEQLTSLFEQPLQERLEQEDGILYNDFINILNENNNNFKRVFDNIMFSTKIIITQKDDFYTFLSLLIENNYTQMALSYLENALALYPQDEMLAKLLKELLQKEDIENSSTPKTL